MEATLLAGLRLVAGAAPLSTPGYRPARLGTIAGAAALAKSLEGEGMARRYSQAASRSVKGAMSRRKRGTLKSGRSGKKVKSRKQAIAIGLSEARRKGKKVPKRGAH